MATTGSLTTLSDQFEEALSRLELGEKRKRVESAHKDIRKVLERDERLQSWGVDTILIGSYARNTAIYPGKDVDVFTKLTELDTSASPHAVFEAVRNVLVEAYGVRARPQARSIMVIFPVDGEEDFHVDVVPAVTKGNRWAIPRRDTQKWEAEDIDERWVETDPEELTELTREMNKVLKVEGQGAYVPVVKLVRQTRKHHRGKQKPGGFYFELLTYRAFERSVEADSFAEIFARTLAAIATHLESDEPLIDPVLNEPYKPEPDPNDRVAAAAQFARLAAEANRALTLDKCAAAVIWRAILGDNDRGPVFPLPPGCNEKGEEIKNIAPVVAVGSREASGFA